MGIGDEGRISGSSAREGAEPPQNQPTAAPGWYPHPSAPGWEAYWSGVAWGPQTRPLNGLVEPWSGQVEQAKQSDDGVGTDEGSSGSWRVAFLCLIGFAAAVFVVVAPFLPSGWITPTDAICFAVAGSALAGSSALAVALLHVRGTAASIAAILIIAAATIVLVTYGLSLFHAYDRWAIVPSHIALLVPLLVLWVRANRPQLDISVPSMRQFREGGTRHPYVAAILVALVCAAGVEAVLALGVAPNNYDSMFYHLSRVGYWMQNDSVFQFYGGSIFQLQHPPNAEILQAWTMELTQGDRFAQFVQWCALWGLVCVIYSGARFLRFTRPASFFAAAVFGTLPLPVLEASSTINDLVSAFFVCAAALFIVRAVASTSIGDAVVGAAALGLAIGTKGTVLLALPALVALVGSAMWKWRPPARFVALGATVVVLGASLLGSPNYLQTALNTGSPIGEQGSVKRRVEPLPESATKTMWAFVDLPGKNAVPPLADLLARGDRAVWGPDRPGVSGAVDVNEYFTGFGPIGFLVMLPLFVTIAVSRSVTADRRLLAAAAVSYIVLFLVLVAAQPFDMRLMIIPMALGAPLLAYIAGVAWLRRSTVVVAVGVLLPVLFFNQVKPLHPGDFSLGKDLFAQRANANVGFDAMLRDTELAISDDQRVGFVGSDLNWDYPLFGPHFERYVVRLPELTSESETTAAMVQFDLDAIVWAIEPPPGVQATRVSNLKAGGQHTDRWVQESDS